MDKVWVAPPGVEGGHLAGSCAGKEVLGMESSNLMTGFVDWNSSD